MAKVQADLRDFVGSIPDHCNTVTTATIRVTQKFFGFPVPIKLCLHYTVVYYNQCVMALCLKTSVVIQNNAVGKMVSPDLLNVWGCHKLSSLVKNTVSEKLRRTRYACIWKNSAKGKERTKNLPQTCALHETAQRDFSAGISPSSLRVYKSTSMLDWWGGTLGFLSPLIRGN